MFDIKNIIFDKIVFILIILLVTLSSNYNYAYSDSKLIINDELVTTHGNMYTQNDINFINIDLLIQNGVNLKIEDTKVPTFSIITSNNGYMLLMNNTIIANTMIDKENVLRVNDKIFIAAREINKLDSNYVVDWNNEYRFLRIKKSDNLVTDQELILKYAEEFGAYQIDGVHPPKNATKFAYLTFDDGPSRNITPALLDILKETNTKVTFFVNGVNASGKEDILKRIVNEGHTLGNHTYSHKSSIYKSFSDFKNEIEKNEKLIYDMTDGYVCTTFRPPYGYTLSDTYKSYLKDKGYMVYYWNVDPGDSTIKNVTSDTIVQNVANQIKNKQDKDVIIILHDMSNKQQSLNSVRRIIKLLWENGYELRAIDNNVQINSTARVY